VRRRRRLHEHRKPQPRVRDRYRRRLVLHDRFRRRRTHQSIVDQAEHQVGSRLEHRNLARRVHAHRSIADHNGQVRRPTPAWVAFLHRNLVADHLAVARERVAIAAHRDDRAGDQARRQEAEVRHSVAAHRKGRADDPVVADLVAEVADLHEKKPAESVVASLKSSNRRPRLVTHQVRYRHPRASS